MGVVQDDTSMDRILVAVLTRVGKSQIVSPHVLLIRTI